MFSADGILGRSFSIASAGLDGLAMRQQVRAENLANIDTEGYRARTVDFESALKSAMSGDDPGHRYSNPLAGGAVDASSGASLSSSFRTTHRGGAPGVDRTTEVAGMMNDNVRFRVLTQQVTNQLSAAKSVIAEMGRG